MIVTSCILFVHIGFQLVVLPFKGNYKDKRNLLVPVILELMVGFLDIVGPQVG